MAKNDVRRHEKKEKCVEVAEIRRSRHDLPGFRVDNGRLLVYAINCFFAVAFLKNVFIFVTLM